MESPSGNHKIAIVIIALIGGVVALHVHSLRTYGVHPQRASKQVKAPRRKPFVASASKGDPVRLIRQHLKATTN